jgi:hypothetical protein
VILGEAPIDMALALGVSSIGQHWPPCCCRVVVPWRRTSDTRPLADRLGLLAEMLAKGGIGVDKDHTETRRGRRHHIRLQRTRTSR